MKKLLVVIMFVLGVVHFACAEPVHLKTQVDKHKIIVASVKPSPTDTDDIRPLKGPEEIKGRIPWILCVLSISILVSGLGLFIYLKRKKEIENLPPIPSRPPEEIAKEALKLLLEERLIQKGMIKEYYIKLSDIIRMYIEGRYCIIALDRTTWELYYEMKSKGIERNHIDRIRSFLDDCDLVKFAKYIPDAKEIETAYKTAEEIIEITTPKDVNSNTSSSRLGPEGKF